MSAVQLQSNESKRLKEEISKKKKKYKCHKRTKKLNMSKENKGYVNNAILFETKNLNPCVGV